MNRKLGFFVGRKKYSYIIKYIIIQFDNIHFSPVSTPKLLSVFIVTRSVLSRKQWSFDLKTKKLVLCVTKRLLCTEKLRFMRANSQKFFGGFAPWNPIRALSWTHWGANSAHPPPLSRTPSWLVCTATLCDKALRDLTSLLKTQSNI